MKFRTKKSRLILAVTLAASLALAGCSTTGQESEAGEDAELVLRYGAMQYPTSMNPASADWGQRAHFQAVFDTLLLATADGTIEPWLATEWEYNEDRTVLTLKLRDDVTFSDGSALTADVVKQNIERYRDGTSPNARYFADVTTVDAVDEHTVAITMAKPNPAFLNYLTRDAGLVGSAEAFANPNIDTEPIGSGPYILDVGETIPATKYVYKSNPDYWNPDVQHYDSIVMTVFNDVSSSVNAVKANEIDIVRLANNAILEEVEAAGWTNHTQELGVWGFHIYDRAGDMNPALADVRVRQALNYAIDRQGLLDALQVGNGTVTEQMFPERSAAFDPELDSRYPYDPEMARELLADAGYGDGLTISMPSTPTMAPETFPLIAQQLADVGITVQYEDVGADYISALLAPRFPLAFMGLEQNPDFQLIQFMLSRTAVWNPFGYGDDTSDALVEEIRFGDEDEQKAAARELNAYVVEQAWFAPFFRAQGNVVTAPGTTARQLPTSAIPAIYDIRPTDD